MVSIEEIKSIKSFKELCERSSELFLECNPTSATNMGIDKFNHLWPRLSHKNVLQEIENLKIIHQKLKEIPPDSLGSNEDRADYILFEWYLDIVLFELEKMRYWEYNPRISGLILSGLNGLLLRKKPTSESNANSMVKRLQTIPQVIEDIKNRATKPAQLWVDGEIKALGTLSSFIKTIPDAFTDTRLIQELEEAATIAIDAINEYQQWLKTIESGSLPINKELYEQLILKRRLGLDPKAIETLGLKYLQNTEEQLNKLVKVLPGQTIEEVRENIRKKHAPSFEILLDEYKEIAQKAEDFIIANDILTIPPNFEHKVVYTPPPMRHLMSLAGASPPGKYKDPQTGYFWVCPHDDLKMLEEHPYAWQSLLMSHESFPGHNIQAICANTHSSAVRTRLFAGPSSNLGLMYYGQLAEIIEGWALYCEQMMLEKGFEDDPANPDPEKQFMLYNAIRWRAARMVIDVRLHTGEFSYEKAVEFLGNATGFNETINRAEVLMYSQSPGYFFSYLTGKHLLVHLKEELQISDKEFHDKILYGGFVPYWFLKEHVFADSL
ncbi:MAG: DUF885 domain-containing protein [Candidatus Hermodarchaeota archaeon]